MIGERYVKGIKIFVFLVFTVLHVEIHRCLKYFADEHFEALQTAIDIHIAESDKGFTESDATGLEDRVFCGILQALESKRNAQIEDIKKK